MQKNNIKIEHRNQYGRDSYETNILRADSYILFIISKKDAYYVGTFTFQDLNDTQLFSNLRNIISTQISRQNSMFLLILRINMHMNLPSDNNSKKQETW